MLIHRHLVLAVLAFAVLAILPAKAETTAELLKKCATDANYCKNSVGATNLMLMMDKTKRGTFCVPKNDDFSIEVSRITDWLSKQPSLSGEPSTSAIEKAYLKLYPVTKACQDTYANPLPATTSAFLAYCATEPKGTEWTCHGEIIGVETLLLTDEPNAICAPKADTKDARAFSAELAERDAAVRTWLKQHAELGANPRRQSIESAYKALYPPPCGSQ